MGRPMLHGKGGTVANLRCGAELSSRTYRYRMAPSRCRRAVLFSCHSPLRTSIARAFGHTAAVAIPAGDGRLGANSDACNDGAESEWNCRCSRVKRDERGGEARPSLGARAKEPWPSGVCVCDGDGRMSGLVLMTTEEGRGQWPGEGTEVARPPIPCRLERARLKLWRKG